MNTATLHQPVCLRKPEAFDRQAWEANALRIVGIYLGSKEEIRQAKHSIAKAIMYSMDSSMVKAIGIDPSVSLWLNNLYEMLHLMEEHAK